ncbi:MAG: peptide chain release factor N(5)-glutamine methyltransferase [Clostridiales bacterium]|nr:peptide chain release factor N(5)-glutamine methyltransferase [Clostridiales bacterium]
MLMRQALAAAHHKLQAAGLLGAEHEARLICAHLCAVEPGQLALFLERAVDEELMARLLKRRIAGEPLQYVLGEAGFMGLDFAVGPGVLIPRADTEVLVEKAISLLKEAAAPLIADIGAGSGAITVSLAHYLPRAVVYGVDISPKALFWANKNARAHGLSGRCRFCEGDMLAPLAALDLRFDLIISNPPYVTAAEMDSLPPEVRQEPASALYGGEDGLTFYRRLAREAGLLLRPGGCLLLEHGWQQQNQVAELLQNNGWQVTEYLSDYGGRARGILAVGCH